MNVNVNRTWEDKEFKKVLPERNQKRIIGLSFPEQNSNLGLEPSILTVLPEGDNVEFSMNNIDFNDNDVEYYLCSVYISGYDEFKEWALKHDKSKIIVGGYHPTTFPEDFTRYAAKVVTGPCDNFWATIEQEGQIVQGIQGHESIPRYDLYDAENNYQVIPEANENDVFTSINTSIGCPFKCDFCCSPMMADKLMSKPLELVQKEVDYLKKLHPDFLFIRDENFPLQPDWKKRLRIINQTGAKIYLFGSANLLSEENIKFMSENGVYMVCLGLEDITTDYSKNKELDKVCENLHKYGIYVYLSFIVDPLKIIGAEKGKQFYNKLLDRFHDLKPEMVCGNFLMPFRGTKLWDDYYAFVSPKDYKHYDSKTPFLIRNELVRDKMRFFMFYNQWKYYTSDFYNNDVRTFNIKDTLYLRFEELYDEFIPMYERLWDKRA